MVDHLKIKDTNNHSHPGQGEICILILDDLVERWFRHKCSLGVLHSARHPVPVAYEPYSKGRGLDISLDICAEWSCLYLLHLMPTDVPFIPDIILHQ